MLGQTLFLLSASFMLSFITKSEAVESGPGQETNQLAQERLSVRLEQISREILSLKPSVSTLASKPEATELKNTSTPVSKVSVVPSPTLILWKFIGKQFKNITALPDITSKLDGGISTVVTTVPKYSPPNIAEKIWSLSVGILSGEYSLTPPTVCSGQPDVVSKCCLASPHPSCVHAYHWDFCSSNPAPDLCIGLYKAGAATSIWKELSTEFANTSQLLSTNDILGGRLAGGKLYFAWPYTSNADDNVKGKYLVTEMSGDLVDRMMSVTYGGLGVDRQLNNISDGSLSLECDSSSKLFKDYAFDSDSNNNVMYVSIGRDTNAAMPTAERAGWSTSFYVESLPDRTRISLVQGEHPTLESTNKLIDFAAIGSQEPQRPLYCLDSVKFGDIWNIKAQLNNSEAALLLFSTSYLSIAFGEYAQ